MKYNLITPGNSTMGKHVACFSLPAVKTCTPSEWCLTGKNGKPRCYALRGRMVLPNVVDSFERKLKASKQPEFVSDIVAEIKRMGLPYFRIHVSGDFYSEQYVNKWIQIAGMCPDVLFRTTTRRVDLIRRLYDLNAMPNVIVRESIDPSAPQPLTALPSASASVRLSDQFDCNSPCSKCGHTCWHKRVNVFFEEY